MAHDGDYDCCNMEILWLLSCCCALSTILTLMIGVILVLLNYSKTATFNKLTLWPYYLLICWSALCYFQYIISAI